MRIDLHCHTKATKAGDGKGRNVSAEMFKTKIEDADVKIVAITNHNAFDLQQFNKLSEMVHDSCFVWPGIEIDIMEPESSRWHLIVVANPKEINAFNDNVLSLINGEKPDDCTRTIEEVCDAFGNRDAIYIAHFHKKPAIPDAEIEKLERLVGEPHRVFRELADEKSMGVFANYRYNVLVGSDVKDWNCYEKSSFSELKLPVDSFEQFCLLAKRDANVVETLLNKKESKQLYAKPAKSVKLPIKVFADINILFGQKGTGKTQIILSLCDCMSKLGLKCVSYIATDRGEDYKSLLSLEGVTVDLDKLGIRSCKEEIKEVSEWGDATPTLFQNYINWWKTDGNNANKKRMRITQASALVYGREENKKHFRQDRIVSIEIQKGINSIDLGKYLDENDRSSLSIILGKLDNQIGDKYLQEIIESEAIILSNHLIKTVKNLADKKTNSVSKPSTTGFIGFVDGRLKLHRAVKVILDSLNAPEKNSKEEIGQLDEKGKIFVNTKLRMLSDASKPAEFKKGNYGRLKEIKKLLLFIKTNVVNEPFSEELQGVKELITEMGLTDVTPFVGRSKQTVDSNGELYEPSNGEKGILLLQRALKDEADAYFLDEPELGMGNSYIDSCIRPMLIDLASQHKYVVVATHNANIAVRTLPYMSIYRTHSNGHYRTYVGNPFSDRLVNIDDSGDVLNWANESLKSLEGSREAFYERKDIYESNNS